MRVFTIATPARIPHARVLARSLREHHPDWRHEVVLLGRDPADAARGDDRVGLRAAADLIEVDLDRAMARHDGRDLELLLVPRLLAAYARVAPEPVLHMPATCWVIGDLSPIERELTARSVLLVPRMTGDVPNDDLEPSLLQMEAAGRVEETMIGTDGSPGSDGFLVWWSRQAEAALGSLEGSRGGSRPEDRPWLARLLELAPARFDTGVLDDPRFNLSLWNLHDRALAPAGAGDRLALADGRPAALMNLAGFEPDRPYRLAANGSRVRVSARPALRHLLARYAQELRDHGWEDLERRRDVGRRLADGTVYDEVLCALHARGVALGERYGDLFGEAGTAAFMRWLEGPAPEGGELGVTRYVYYRVARERPDVLRAYPDLDGGDGDGYVAWCHAFGAHELAIPARFLPGSVQRGAERRRSPDLQDVPKPAPAPATTEPPVASWEGNGSAPLPGVRLTGYLGHALGLGAAARGYARALGAAGVPVSTVTVPLHHLTLPGALGADYGRHAFEDLRQDGQSAFDIVAVNADELPDFVQRLGPGYFEGPVIGIWGWETNSIPARWERAFSLVDEIWVYSRFMAENIGAVAPVPVTPLPPPVEPAAGGPLQPLRLGVGPGFLFLFIFDYLSTIQRKNPVGLIEAFKAAFEPGEGPQLLIKTINGPLRPLAEEEVLWSADERPDIHVVDRSLTAEELAGVLAACDCYASLHRAEGFGLTLAEAMALGKPVIATGYSGNVDFMDASNSYLVDYELGRVGPDCEIYPADGEWADPDLAHAASLMRQVYEDRASAAEIGARAREDVLRMLSPETTGAAMLARLRELSTAPGAATARA